MKRLSFFAALTAVITASTVVADVPLPPGIQYVVPRVRFAGVEKYPDHVFYLKFTTGTGAPKTPMRFEVKKAEPITLTGSQRRITNMYLLALDRKEFEKRKGEDATFAWLSEKTPGVLSASLIPPSTTGSTKDKEVPVTEYEAAITDGKLTVSKVKMKASSELAPDREMRPWVIGIAIALSLAFFGVWFVRRRPI
jgi:hypothetical protein